MEEENLYTRCTNCDNQATIEFLCGFVGYYRKFTLCYAQVDAASTNLTKNHLPKKGGVVTTMPDGIPEIEEHIGKFVDS